MIPITDPRIEDYLMRLSFEADPHLLALEKMARERGFPIVDRLVGRFLWLLTRVKRPRLIVELGSGFGYSAYWFARALDQLPETAGKVVLIDYAELNIAHARRLFEIAGLAGRAEFRVGDALEIGKEYQGIDLLFIDVDKYQYPAAIRTMLPRLGSNALVIADNALWSGRVLEPEPDKDAEGIRQFNQFMFSHHDMFATLVPLRDGVLLAYKLS